MNVFPLLPLHITVLLSFGILLLTGAVGGALAHRLRWLPSISGFMVAGYVIGPGGFDFLPATTLAQSRILVDIALGLILYRLGLSLHVGRAMASPRLLLLAFVECSVTFFVTSFVLSRLGVSWAPALLVAAIVVSSSPAVLIHVAHELRAKGPVTETARNLVALNNVVSFVLFSACLPLVQLDAGNRWNEVLLMPLYKFLGSLLLGVLMGYALHRITGFLKASPQYMLALVIAFIMLTLGLAEQLKLSLLFAPLVLGIAAKSLGHGNLLARLDFGEAFELFFVVLFVSAGANLHLSDILAFAPLVLAVVVARTFSKWISVLTIGSLFKEPAPHSLSAGFLLTPMAGLAIGLVHSVETVVPDQSRQLAAIVLGSVAIFELVGPPLAAYAFRLAGEAGVASHEDDN